MKHWRTKYCINMYNLEPRSQESIKAGIELFTYLLNQCKLLDLEYGNEIGAMIFCVEYKKKLDEAANLIGFKDVSTLNQYLKDDFKLIDILNYEKKGDNKKNEDIWSKVDEALVAFYECAEKVNDLISSLFKFESMAVCADDDQEECPRKCHFIQKIKTDAFNKTGTFIKLYWGRYFYIDPSLD